MDQTIGEKGGYNDRKRQLNIQKKKKKKQEKELEELEKQVKIKQRYTIIKTIPIIITGITLKELFSKKRNTKKESKNNILKKITLEPNEDKNKEIVVIIEKQNKEKIKVLKEIKPKELKNIDNNKKTIKNKISVEKEYNVSLNKTPVEIKYNVLSNKTNIIKKNNREKTKNNFQIKQKPKEEFQELTISQQEKLEKLKSRKIVDVYEKQLKEIRYELRNLILDYKILVDTEQKITESKEAEILIEKLNYIIQKLEKLKDKIDIDNIDKYDDNYLYTLIEEYLEEFKDEKIIKKIKDSELYITISKKIDELDKKKDILKKNIKEKKESLDVRDKQLEDLKEKYYDIDKVNKELYEFQLQQASILKEIRQRIDNASTVSEKVKIEMEAMSYQSSRLLRRLTLALLFPGVRTSKRMATLTAAYMYFSRELLNPKTITKKYKIIKVADYSKDIEKNIDSIDEANFLLRKTSKQVNKLISLIKTDFKEYIGVIKECDQLLYNLENIKNSLKEKEYEMEIIKQKEQKELERNNMKVLTKGEYPM
ncbi:MAG: hypothetical protein IJ097_02625 [Bacilli bacterium]|nr:hypothetical protein [Bacilli bacterium]